MSYMDHIQQFGQTHLLPASPALIHQLEQIDWKVFEKQRQTANANLKRQYELIHDLDAIQPYKHPAACLQNKQLGLLIMAGGQATRLGLGIPKALVQITTKTLLQILIEKALAFNKLYSTTVHVGIMTSQESFDQIREYLVAHDFFSYPQNAFSIYAQASLPLLDANGKFLLNACGNLMLGPDGNGSLFRTFQPLIKTWQNKDVISVIQIDNPLIDPFHPAILEPIFSGHDLSIAAIAHTDTQEKVGLFARENEYISVIEYSELTPEEMLDTSTWANISSFACTPQFALSSANHQLPLHIAKKKMGEKEVFKAEYFIFDHFPYAQNPAIVPIDRQLYFSPVKNKYGPESLETARKALQKQICGLCLKPNLPPIGRLGFDR